jgi:DNA-binding response OmpR family regulator
MNILIVDDDSTTAGWLTEAITEMGHRADTAPSGQRARERVRARDYDLALLDLFLPDIRGYELIPEFSLAQPDMKVIVMTGFSSKELETEARRHGVIYYLIKPVRLDEITNILDHLSRREASTVKTKGGLS